MALWFRITLIAFVAGYAALLPAYVYAENKRGFRAATSLKLTLSGIFTLIALLGAVLGKLSAPLLLIAAAGAFSFLGDYYLQFIKKDDGKYCLGVISFGFAQICLLVSLYLRAPAGVLEFILLAALLGAALWLMTAQKWNLGALRGPLSVYTFLLAFMTAKAISVPLTTGGAALWELLFAAGGALFFTSDLLLGIWNYHRGEMKYANWNWATYFAGQLLIALSAVAAAFAM